MDVVRSNVRRLNGRVSVKSAVGKGSIFTLKLPLTLAIIDALLMRSGGQVFALPGTAVEETLLVPIETVSHLTQRRAINLRGEVLGVSSLRELLQFKNGDEHHAARGPSCPWSWSPPRAGGWASSSTPSCAARRWSSSPSPRTLASLPGISGASIMGDGGVVLILDPAELMALAVQEAL